jgi:hypothetical protein
MKEFRNNTIDNCNSTSTDYKQYFLTYINYKLLQEIIKLFDLSIDETDIALLNYLK